MKLPTIRLLTFSVGVCLAQGAWAMTSYSCDEIGTTTRDTFEKVVTAGRREIARTEDDGGAMDKPKPAADISCEAEKWRQVVAASMTSYWGNGGSQAASLILQGYMNRLITDACAKLNNEMDRARGRLEAVTRPPSYVVRFPYPWSN